MREDTRNLPLGLGAAVWFIIALDDHTDHRQVRGDDGREFSPCLRDWLSCPLTIGEVRL